MEAFLKQTYYDPAHPAGFSGIKKLTHAAKRAGFNDASYGKVKKWLLSQDVYATTIPSRKSVGRTPVHVAGLNAQFDIDLADLSQYASDNDGWCYIVAAIDIFSRFLMTRKLKTKKPAEVGAALTDIFTKDRRPKYVARTDAGQELCAKAIQPVYKRFGLHHIITRNETKANYIERALKTIKGRLFKYFMFKQKHRWVDVFEKVTDSYNSSIHRSLGDAPVNITPRNEAQSRIRQYMIRHNLDEHGNLKPPMIKNTVKKEVKNSSKTPPSTASLKRAKPKYKVGRLVRVSRLRYGFFREYSQKWSNELFKVKSARMRDSKVPVYVLEDLAGETLKGTFYQEEIEPAVEPEGGAYKISKILGKRGRGRNLQYRVAWLGWPKKFNSWIRSADLTDIPGVDTS